MNEWIQEHKRHIALKVSSFGKMWWPLKGPFCDSLWSNFLTAKSVQGTSLPLQSIDDIHGCDCLPLGMLGVGDGITDDILKEHLQDTTGLLVDEARDTLHTTSAGKTTDGWLGDTLDVITQNLPVALGTTLSKTFTSFTTSRHSDLFSSISDWQRKWMPGQGKKSSLYSESRHRALPWWKAAVRSRTNKTTVTVHVLTMQLSCSNVGPSLWPCDIQSLSVHCFCMFHI